MKIKIKNKITAILLVIAMFFVGIFTLGGIKKNTAKADSGTTYSGNDIDDIAASFMWEALNHFGVCEGSWILLDDQILNANGAWESLLASIVELMNLTPASNSDSDRMFAITNAGVNIIKFSDDATWAITGGNLDLLSQKANNLSLGMPHVCGIGIWQLNLAAYNEFYNLQMDIWNTYSELMPIYVIEREEIIFGESGLVLWVYDEVNGGFWLTADGRPEWWID